MDIFYILDEFYFMGSKEMVELDKSDKDNKEICDYICKFDDIRALIIYMLSLVNTFPFVYRMHDAND